MIAKKNLIFIMHVLYSIYAVLVVFRHSKNDHDKLDELLLNKSLIDIKVRLLNNWNTTV